MNHFIIITSKEENIIDFLQIYNDDLLDIYDSVIQKNDHYDIKQYIRFYMYVYFIDAIKHDVFSMNNFYKKIKQIREYLIFRNQIVHNLPEENDSFIHNKNNIIEHFIKNTINYSNIFNDNCSTQKPFNYNVSEKIYHQVINILEKENFQELQENITINIKNSCHIFHLANRNKTILDHLEKENPFYIAPTKNKRQYNRKTLLKIKEVLKPTNELVVLNSKEKIDVIIEDKTKQEIMQENISQMKENIRQMEIFCKKSIEKKKEKINYEIQKEYCRNTILLDVDKMKNTLNTDVMNHIRGFVGEEFIEDTRKHIIQKNKFTPFKKIVEKMLLMWGNKRVKQLEKHCIYLKYNMHVNDIENMDIYDYTNDDFLHFFYEERIYKLFRKNRAEHTLVRIMNVERIGDYFEFQRNVWILHHNVFGFSTPVC